MSPSAPLLRLLHAINRDISEAAFPFASDAAAEYLQLRTRLDTQVRTHLLPRVADDASPAIVVLGGSTGAGKSTILNSLVGREVSPAGVLRPTTRRAVVAHHPGGHSASLRDFADSVASSAIPPGLVLLDAPDLDSLENANREMASRLLEAADLWVFVTTATRYGDQLPWSNLERARRRGLQVAVIANRVPGRARKAVRADLMQRLDGIGLGFVPMFLFEDHAPHEGPLPEVTIAPFRDWLFAAAGRQQSRGIVRRTARGAWSAVHDGLLELSEGVAEQAAAARSLRDATRAATAGPEQDMAAAVRSGQPAAGAPTTRWDAQTRAEGALAPLARPGRVTAWRGERQRAARDAAMRAVADDVAAALTTLLTDAVLEAAVAIDRVWRAAAAQQVPPGGDAGAVARQLAEESVASWRAHVAGLARQAQPTGRALALLGVDGVTDLVVAGAAGVEGAAQAADLLLGMGPALAAARESLETMVRDTVRAVPSPYLAVLRGMPTTETVKRLRMRAAQLREYLDG